MDDWVEYEFPIPETGFSLQSVMEKAVIALRADMDALPIHETADVDFKSEVRGKCMLVGMTVIRNAARRGKNSQGKRKFRDCKFPFSPCEEGVRGQKMTNEGALDDPEVERIFGYMSGQNAYWSSRF
ncbi:MAG: hypothetical protein Ct9H90mP23_2500 [Methanobacteriota archaeon]|nr:MAG: hypothetical protein Ct9H90mP23_2500 [Euryarchaeota archaeon]